MPELVAIDFSLRLMCLGQLLLFICLAAWQPVRHRRVDAERLLLICLLFCCTCALLLTGNYRPPWILQLRPVLLAFTDALPFVFWAYGALSLSDLARPIRLQSWWGLVGGIYLIWHAYFFIVLEGQGIYHDVNHWLAVVAGCHLVYLCIGQWRDDLVDARRRLRAMLIISACAVMAIFITSEISGAIFMRSEIGSITGAGLLLSLSTALGVFFLTEANRDQEPKSEAEPSPALAVTASEIPVQHQALYQQLIAFMNDQGFTESRLTLTRLAERLNTQEHRLRSLINQCLGYRNFSNYLNDHRLPLACKLLTENEDLAITDLAYDLGYGSISSFNRAFKESYGVSPSSYRAQT
ncbi:AraC family transcriptional regulator [Halioglobus maricola]|uniref:AraC family transcriptional regulator n=1 Tax=Halioglobus maricola TaxID=2601894 RepID=A0A5P9NFV8_9GAMM|nr:helix-turn-helix domain-containing protein [Halioglobus maricola]QFU74416.1 AraC family transcriptional regulator [Halioglobus maricola]